MDNFYKEDKKRNITSRQEVIIKGILAFPTDYKTSADVNKYNEPRTRVTRRKAHVERRRCSR